MFNRYYWSMDSWGNGYPPVNADDVIAAANDIIDNYIENNPDAYEDELHDYSNDLWEDFCSSGRIGDVVAVYEDEEGEA